MGWSLRQKDGRVLSPALRPPPADAHKYARGHVVVVSGPRHRTGAARLAATAALRVGAGLVMIVGEPDALDEHAAHLTAIMLRTRDATFSAIDARVRAIAVGPGLGTGDGSRAAVHALLDRHIPIVLDADALTVFADDPSALFGRLHPGVVLTPHEGEFARIFPLIALADRAMAAREAAAMCGATVLLKGPNTVIAEPNGAQLHNDHATPWLATAGAGDVLTGMIAGLLAQDSPPFAAAAMAAWLHGEAGRRAGPGLTADDLPAQLPAIMRNCLGSDGAVTAS